MQVFLLFCVMDGGVCQEPGEKGWSTLLGLAQEPWLGKWMQQCWR